MKRKIFYLLVFLPVLASAAPGPKEVIVTNNVDTTVTNTVDTNVTNTVDTNVTNTIGVDVLSLPEDSSIDAVSSAFLGVSCNTNFSNTCNGLTIQNFTQPIAMHAGTLSLLADNAECRARLELVSANGALTFLLAIIFASDQNSNQISLVYPKPIVSSAGGTIRMQVLELSGVGNCTGAATAVVDPL